MDDRHSDSKVRSEALVRYVPQKALRERTRAERLHIFSAVTNGIMVLVNIFMFLVMFKSYQGESSDSKLLDDAVRTIKQANQNAGNISRHAADLNRHAADVSQRAADVTRQLDDALAIQRESVKVQRRVADALERSARVGTQIETKPLQVDEAYLGNVQLLKTGDGSFTVRSFTGCPQLKIRIYNPGSLPNSGVFLVSGYKDQVPFRCREKLEARLSGHEKDDIFLNLSSCFSGFSECSGGGSIKVRAEE